MLRRIPRIAFFLIVALFVCITVPARAETGWDKWNRIIAQAELDAAEDGFERAQPAPEAREDAAGDAAEGREESPAGVGGSQAEADPVEGAPEGSAEGGPEGSARVLENPRGGGETAAGESSGQGESISLEGDNIVEGRAADPDPAPEDVEEMTDPAPNVMEEDDATETVAPASEAERVPVVEPTRVYADEEEEEDDEDRRPRSSNRFRIGPDLGIYFPTDDFVRNRFGESWFTWGISFGGVGQADPRGRFEPEINFIYRNNNNGHVFLAPIGVAYRKALTRNPNASATLYAGASANAVIADVQSAIDNIDTGTEVVAGGSVFAGINLRDNAYVEARYRTMGKVGGFDFSGFRLSAGFRF